MQNADSFNLDQAIQHWRDNLAQSPAFSGENLGELEAHLRDSIASLQARDLSAEESFIIATKRLGSRNVLAAEFGRVNSRSVWLDRILWMLVGIQCWGLVYGLAGTLLRSAVFFGLVHYDFSTYGRTIPTMLFLLANLSSLAASLIGCWWLFFRHGSTIGGWLSGYLSRRSTWQLGLFGTAFWVLSFWLNFGMTLLQFKLVAAEKFGPIASSQSYTWAAGSFVQVLTFLILTIVIARKQLARIEA